MNPLESSQTSIIPPKSNRRISRRAGSDADTVDRTLRHSGGEKTTRIDLGLAILDAVRVPGHRYTQEEIAAFCGCTRSMIFAIEQRALRKLRNRLRFLRDDRLRDLADALPILTAARERGRA